MATIEQTLLVAIEAFIAETGMGESYFGKKSVGNSELVARLREGRRVWPETAASIRSFIRSERKRLRSSGRGNSSPARQAPAAKKRGAA